MNKIIFCVIVCACVAFGSPLHDEQRYTYDLSTNLVVTMEQQRPGFVDIVFYKMPKVGPSGGNNQSPEVIDIKSVKQIDLDKHKYHVEPEPMRKEFFIGRNIIKNDVQYNNTYRKDQVERVISKIQKSIRDLETSLGSSLYSTSKIYRKINAGNFTVTCVYNRKDNATDFTVAPNYKIECYEDTSFSVDFTADDKHLRKVRTDYPSSFQYSSLLGMTVYNPSTFD